MARKYGLVGLVIVLVLVVALLPWLKNTFAAVFPEGFRDVDCKGVTCNEGEFCQENKCHKIYPAATNQIF
jgi:hypothetical protein